MEKNPSYPVQPPSYTVHSQPYPPQPMQYAPNVVIQPVIAQRPFLGKDPCYVTWYLLILR